MSEPKYDEDLVNLGYLNRVMSREEQTTGNISRNYGSRPNPPYYKGDTWIDGDIVYTCINTRTIGMYNANDWTTESGATEIAESKNKIYLTQPSNYKVGDMWILQTDNDHKSGKKGDILITTVGRSEYDADDWVNMISYGTIASINEVLGNINEAIKQLELAKESGTLTIVYSDTEPSVVVNDLWYVTADTGDYSEGELYKYTSDGFVEIIDEEIVNTIAEANQTTITEDGQIQIFYEERDNVTTMTLGDLCNDNEVLYRYNGTKWVLVYDTKLEETIRDLTSVTNRVVSITTDLGQIQQTVSETMTVTDSLTGQIESINEEISNIQQTQNNWIANFKQLGGNNLFYYSLDLWDTYSGLEEYTNTDIQHNSLSGRGYLVNAGTSNQDVQNIQNDVYTVSFKYKKIGSDLSSGSVKINGTEYALEEDEWTTFSQTIEVTTNHLEVEFTADTNETLYIADLMGNLGREADIWTQHPNEVRTDTVKIGKGIEVSSSTTDTKLKADADGVRVVQASNQSNVVAEFTDKGIRTKELECEGQAQIGGLLIKQVGDQTWISSLL